MKKKALVLLSGGLDSTTALALADDRGREVHAVNIFYGQRHAIEVEAAKLVAQWYNVELTSLDIPLPNDGSVLMDHSSDVPHLSYSDIEGVSPTYVSFRNATMLSHASAIALATDCEEVWFGAHADDAENWAYPDCTPEFIGAMQNAIYIGTYMKVRLIAPFTYMDKAEVVGVGTELKVPYELTRSCYSADLVPCGECPTCISRLEAFAKNNRTDPAQYIRSHQ